MVVALQALRAEATREHRLDGDAVPYIDAPALGGAVPDPFNDADPFIHPALIMSIQEGGDGVARANFDFVLLEG